MCGVGGMGVTSAWSPLGNFLEGQAHPNVFAFQQFSSSRGLSLFLCREVSFSCVFCVCFPVVQGFSPRLCLFSKVFSSNSLYILYIFLFIYFLYIFSLYIGFFDLCWVTFIWDVAPGLIVQRILCTYRIV